MAKMNNKVKLYSKKTVAIVLVVLICLFVIYRFNINTKSENNDALMTSVQFKENELGLNLKQDLQLNIDEDGNYYFVFPKKVDKYFVDEFYVIESEKEKESIDIDPYSNNKNIINGSNINELVTNVVDNSTSLSLRSDLNEIKIQGKTNKFLIQEETNKVENNTIVNNSEKNNNIVENNNINNNVTSSNRVSNDTINSNSINNVVENNNTTMIENTNTNVVVNNVNSNNVNSNNVNNEITNTINDSSKDNQSDSLDEIKKSFQSGDKYFINGTDNGIDVENLNLTIEFTLKSTEINGIKLYDQELIVEDSGNTISVSGFMPQDYFLEATKQENKVVEDLTADVEELAENEVLFVYDLKIKKDDKEYQPKDYFQTLKVAITSNAQFHEKIEDGDVQVLHIVETDDQILFEKIAIEEDVETIKNDKTEFIVDSFSPYAVIVSPTITATKITINEYAEDFNFFMGQNYTYGEDYGKNYSEDSFAKVTINYYGYNTNQSLNGYISDSERQYCISYVKAIPIDANGKYKIELIDNPYMDRPAGYGFDGWVLNSTDSSYSSDKNITIDSYTKVQTISGNCPANKNVTIDLYVNWKKANVIFLSNEGNDNYDGKSITSPVKTWSRAKTRLNNSKISATNASSRELNIIVLIKGDFSLSNSNYYNLTGTISGGYTVTSLYDGINYSNNSSLRLAYATTMNQDFQVHHITFYEAYRYQFDDGVDAMSYALNGGSYNLRFGRGIVKEGNYVTITQLCGGNSGKVYRTVVESGLYDNIQIWNPSSSNTTLTATCVLGSDIDRAKPASANANNNLKVYNRTASRSGSGTKNGSTRNILYNGDYLATNNNILYFFLIKSGTFGKDYFDANINNNNSDMAYSGIYVGGHGSSAIDNGSRIIVVEGGVIANIIGGLMTQSKSTTTETYIYQKGGTIDNIVGGAGVTVTYGDRFIQLTGGKINYSVSGGSNGYKATKNDEIGNNGRLVGNSTVYVGGTSQIGNSTTINNTLYNVQGGCVLGAGNGSSTYKAYSGSVSRSRVFIDGGATIYGNVFGGGNFGKLANPDGNGSYTGDDESRIVWTSNIHILGGTINGDIYGGPNNNDVNGNTLINIDGGYIKGTVYGGSNTAGEIKGSSKININGGDLGVYDPLIDMSTVDVIVGGGKGKDTNIVNDTTVNIRDTIEDININGNIYGGSALGTVDGNTQLNINDKFTDKSISINGNAFGGGKGDSTQKTNTQGDVKVSVDGGTYSTLKVFGGCNISGEIEKGVSVEVGKTTSTYLQEVYGSGNKSNLTTETDNLFVTIYENATVFNAFNGGSEAGFQGTNKDHPRLLSILGAKVTNAYGACNSKGDYSESYVLVTDGATVGNVYGSGYGSTAKVTGDTNITITSLDQVTGELQPKKTVITGNVYGGGYEAGVNQNTNITIESSEVRGNVFGGSYSGVVKIKSNININNSTINNVYGGGNDGKVGSNTSVDDLNTEVTITGSVINGNVYGGGLGKDASIKGNSYIKFLDNSVVTSIYGGGDAGVIGNSTKVEITDSTVSENVFGGGNAALVTGNTEVILNKSLVKNVYGGGNKGISGVDDNNTTNVLIKNLSNVTNTAFAGGNAAEVLGTANITVENSKVNQAVYGGGQSADVNQSNVTMTQNSKTGVVFGGGDLGNIVLSTNVDLYNSTIGITECTLDTNGNVFAGGNGTIVETDKKGQVGSEAKVTLHDMIIDGSVFGGGNGKSATVIDKAHVICLGTTSVNNSVYGGGNNAQVGLKNSVIPSNSYIEISGGNIAGDVFGGANYNAIYGNASIFIGNNAINTYYTPQGYNYDKITINGTVYGGGNSPGKDAVGYDPEFKSVTGDIKIYIDGAGYETKGLELKDSIFGSGNISNSTKNGDILIKNYGTEANKKTVISIQRAFDVIIDNSILRITGAYDSTATFANIPYTLNIVDNLKLKNNSSLYLVNTVRCLGNFSSVVDVGGTEQYAQVTVKDDGSGVQSRNVDNRIYMSSASNFNVSPDEGFLTYGSVKGMTYFGIFKEQTDSTGNIIENCGMYDKSYETSGKIGSNLTWEERNYDRTYATGLPVVDYNVDGFYTIFEEITNGLDEKVELTEENYSGFSKMQVIKPEDLDSYYIWYAGPNEDIYYYNFALMASKFSTLGTYELALQRFMFPNATINVTSFDTALQNGAKLIDKNTIPSINEDQEKADTEFGLAMKTGNIGWNMVGSTDFYSSNQIDGKNYSGTTKYSLENSNVMPSLKFYLYSSNNISKDSELGHVTIRMRAYYWADELTQGTATIIIDINLSTMFTDMIGYNGAITPGVQYELFTATEANITTKSSFSSYFELAEKDFFNNEKVIEHYDTAYRYVEIMDAKYYFPENTTITMIDRSDKNNPTYYYYTVTAQDEANKKSRYRFTEFTKMGSTNGVYDEENIRDSYIQVIDGTEYEYECFIFIVNFENADFSGYPPGSEITSGNTFKIGLQDDYIDEFGNPQVETLATLIGSQASSNIFGIYDADSTVGIEASLSKPKIYLGDEEILNLDSTYSVKMNSVNGLIYDTQYFDKKLGVKISLYHENNSGALELVPGSALLGAYFELNGEKYFPSADGTTRIKLAELVSNASSKIEFNTDNASIETDDYIMKIESFGSPDGIYFGLTSSDKKEIELQIVNNSYGLDSVIPPEQTIIDKETGHTMTSEGVISEADDANELNVSLTYQSGLGDPYIGVSLYRRNYDATNVYENQYTLVDLQDYLEDTLVIPNEVGMTNPTIDQNNYINTIKQFNDSTYVYKAVDTSEIKLAVGSDTMKNVNFNLVYNLKDNLTTGTYKLVFTLYDAYAYKHQRPTINESGGITYETYDMFRYANVGDTFSYIIVKGKNE